MIIYMQTSTFVFIIAGSVREQTNQKPPYIKVQTPPTTFRPPPATTPPTPPPPKSDTALQATTTECPPNGTTTAPISNKNNNNLLRKLASSHYQSYTTALTITIAVGCFLLLLNIMIFAGIYHQRDRGKSNKKKKEELVEAGSCSSSSGEAYEAKCFESSRMNYEACKTSYEMSKAECKAMYIGEYSCDKKMMESVQLTELPLQEFNSSPHSAMKRTESSRGQSCQPPDVTSIGQEPRMVTSPSIPEPPPPRRISPL